MQSFLYSKEEIKQIIFEGPYTCAGNCDVNGTFPQTHKLWEKNVIFFYFTDNRKGIQIMSKPTQLIRESEENPYLGCIIVRVIFFAPIYV